jgi:hypothetical protein
VYRHLHRILNELERPYLYADAPIIILYILALSSFDLKNRNTVYIIRMTC